MVSKLCPISPCSQSRPAVTHSRVQYRPCCAILAFIILGFILSIITVAVITGYIITIFCNMDNIHYINLLYGFSIISNNFFQNIFYIFYISHTWSNITLNILTHDCFWMILTRLESSSAESLTDQHPALSSSECSLSTNTSSLVLQLRQRLRRILQH